MASPVYVLPDPMLLLLEYLRLRPEVTTLVPGAKVITQLPANPTYPYVLVSWVGSESIWPAISEDSLQVDCMAADQPTASLLARTVRAAIWSISNDITAHGVLVSGWEELAPQWIPDDVPTPPVARFMARYRIVTHP